MSEMLFECLSEEMPVGMQSYAVERFERQMLFFLSKCNVKYKSLVIHVTPRRIAVMVFGIELPDENEIVEVRGPRCNAEASAVKGFLDKYGADRGRLIVKSIEKGDFFHLNVHRDCKNIATVLKLVMESVMQSIHWPQLMYWGKFDFQWIRPIISILCIFDGKVVPVKFHTIEAKNTTVGHRFLSNGKPFTVVSIDDYKKKMEKNFVFLNHDARIKYIEDSINTIASDHELEIEIDPSLLKEVAGKTEWPNLLMGRIDPVFMSLPTMVLISVMRYQQGYFHIFDPDKKQLAPFFVTVSHVVNDSVIKGNEKVLCARLSDARFLIENDMKHKLDHYSGFLPRIVFHNKLGTVKEKVGRIRELVRYIMLFYPVEIPLEMVERAVMLVKADLATGMVKDFPHLQGAIGAHYARISGEDEIIARAIVEHYYPLNSVSEASKLPLAVIISIADKMDSVIGLVAIGTKLSSAKDPFGIRRSVLGIIKTIVDNEICINLDDLISRSIELYKNSNKVKISSAAVILQNMLDFFLDKVRIMLKKQGVALSVIDAVKYKGDIFKYVRDVDLLCNFTETQFGHSVLKTYKRINNILSKEEKKEGRQFSSNYSSELLLEKVEYDLASKLALVQEEVADLLERDDFLAALELIMVLYVFLNDFIDSIVVNCEAVKIRNNRLALLANAKKAFSTIANFDLLV